MNNGNNPLFLAGSVILAGILIAGAVIWNGQHPANPSAPGTQGSGAAPSVNIADVNTSNSPFIGQPNAPVTIAFWSDFQCPFCKMFETQTLPQVVQDYVNQGKVKVVFMDFPFLGPDSMTDAEYARAVWSLYPNLYYKWRTALFNSQPQENSLGAAANISFLKTTTLSVSGLDWTNITAAVQANQSTYDAAINADKSEGTKEGVNATPSFIIGTQLIAGAQPYSVFQQAIAAQLGK